MDYFGKETDYQSAEFKTLIAPFVRKDPSEIAGMILLTVDQDGNPNGLVGNVGVTAMLDILGSVALNLMGGIVTGAFGDQREPSKAPNPLEGMAPDVDGLLGKIFGEES